MVCPDLRGYGQSSSPPPQPEHAQASKRAMAGDIVTLMSTLGVQRFAVVGHDRGSYAVTRLAVLDSVPIGEALTRADARWCWPCWRTTALD